MVLILDGDSENGAHVNSEIGFFICVRHLFRSKIFEKKNFIKKHFLQRVLIYHLSSMNVINPGKTDRNKTRFCGYSPEP